MKAKKRKELKYRSGKAKSDTLERSPEQVRENAKASYPMQKPEKTYEQKLEEARLRRERNARINKRRDASGRDKKGAPRLDDQNLRNKDGSPLRGGPKATPIAPKEIPTETPKKTLKRSKAVIPVPTKKEVRKARRKNRN